MPHKRNPILSERLCGLSRVLRGFVVPGLENIALWHERDISHSSVERLVLPDALGVAYYVLDRAARLVEGLVVNEERMRANLDDGSLGLVFSQSVLLALIDAGLERDTAYRVVQRAALEASAGRRHLREVLEADDQLAFDKSVLDEAFSLDRVLEHVHRFADALEEVGQ
jgi:adenylosuccinate lyase